MAREVCYHHEERAALALSIRHHSVAFWMLVYRQRKQGSGKGHSQLISPTTEREKCEHEYQYYYGHIIWLMKLLPIVLFVNAAS